MLYFFSKFTASVHLNLLDIWAMSYSVASELLPIQVNKNANKYKSEVRQKVSMYTNAL